MVVLAAVFHIRMIHVESLKDKRRVIKSLTSRISNRFNASAAEVGSNDSHDYAEIGIAAASSSKSHLESVFESILQLVDDNHEFIKTDFEKEFIYM